MLREKFFDALGEHDRITVTFRINGEIPTIFRMPIVSVEDYDDEIVIRGDGGTFLTVSGDPVVDNENDEYYFEAENYQIGIVFS